MQIGVVSDTHGSIHPEVFSCLKGSRLILHAGDIGGEDIITELETIAPVKAVTGNTDVFPITERFKHTEIIEISGKKVYLIHRYMEGGGYKVPSVVKDIEEKEPDIVVFGHTHMQHAQVSDGRLYFNPGSAGQRRPGKRLGAGIIKINESTIDHQIFYLD